MVFLRAPIAWLLLYWIAEKGVLLACSAAPLNALFHMRSYMWHGPGQDARGGPFCDHGRKRIRREETSRTRKRGLSIHVSNPYGLVACTLFSADGCGFNVFARCASFRIQAFRKCHYTSARPKVSKSFVKSLVVLFVILVKNFGVWCMLN